MLDRRHGPHPLIGVGIHRCLPDDPEGGIQQAKLAKILAGGAKPEEIAGIVTFLASDAARYINATVVHANGGIDF